MAAGQARITITPNATNAVRRTWHSWVVTVQKDEGAGFVAAPGVAVAVTVTGTLGATYSDATGGSSPYALVTNAAGQCQFGFVALTPGRITGHAEGTVVVLGVPVFVSTGVTPGSGADAITTWREARISLSPLASSTAVGVNQTVTALLERDLGTGAGFVAYAGIAATIRLTNQDGAVAAPAGPVTGNTNGAGQLAATFTSASPGGVRVRASAALVTVPELPVTTGVDEAVGAVVEPQFATLPDATAIFT